MTPRYKPDEVTDDDMEEFVNGVDDPEEISLSKAPSRKEISSVKHIDERTLRIKPKTRQSQISQGVEKEAVIDKLLNTTIPNLTIRELLGTSSEITDQISLLIKRKNPAAKETTVEIARKDTTSQENPPEINLFTRDDALLIKMPVESGAQLNLMKKSVFQEEFEGMYPIHPLKTMNIRDVHGVESYLAGRVPGVQINHGIIKTKGTFYLSDTLPYDMILGRPWQRDNLTLELAITKEEWIQSSRLQPTGEQEVESEESESDLEASNAEEGEDPDLQEPSTSLSNIFLVANLSVVKDSSKTSEEKTLSTSEQFDVKDMGITLPNNDPRSKLNARLRYNWKRYIQSDLEEYIQLVNRRGTGGIESLWSEDDEPIVALLSQLGNTTSETSDGRLHIITQEPDGIRLIPNSDASSVCMMSQSGQVPESGHSSSTSSDEYDSSYESSNNGDTISLKKLLETLSETSIDRILPLRHLIIHLRIQAQDLPITLRDL
ncbi:hypothetical protein BDZ89DRAFT_1132534 [Hymenopellis radicata]|nr:hypothetical protein BDZ89DRAFT_1132534 [Hymenopellis radicata]